MGGWSAFERGSGDNDALRKIKKPPCRAALSTTLDNIGQQWISSNFITNLAPEGETALIVRQKPQLKDGELQFHADGAIKCTWPAYLPSRGVQTGQAWYGNTASFIIDRFTEGKPSASAANCEYVLVMVLDDVGDPLKAPNLPPYRRRGSSRRRPARSSGVTSSPSSRPRASTLRLSARSLTPAIPTLAPATRCATSVCPAQSI
jgi:hypothetical protein